MTDQTPNLVLPYIAAAQSQKHVTHNEAIRMLDAVVQIGVATRTLSAPPAAPLEGDRHIVPSGASGAWAGFVGQIAAWQDGAWAFYTPREGWLAWVSSESKLYVFTGSAWTPQASGSTSVNPVDLVGVNATADATNRLAVSSVATLLNHDGAGHQLKINKAASAETASLVFQNGFSGRAEFGMTGDDNFHVKVSPDGEVWKEAIVVDRTSGLTSIRALESVQVSLAQDRVIGIAPPTPSGILAISQVHPTTSSAVVAGILSYDAGVSPGIATLGIGSGIANGNVTVLTGTTGVVGKVTIAAATGQLSIENRLTASTQLCITFINGFRALT